MLLLAASIGARMSGAQRSPPTLTALVFDSAVCTSSPANRGPPPTGISSLRPIMSMLSTAATVDSGASGASVYAHAPSSPRLLGIPRREQHAPLGPVTVSRGEGVRFGDFDERNGPGPVVVGAVEHLIAVGALMIVVSRHDHPLVLPLRIAAFEERDNVAIGNDVAIDGGVDVDLHARERDRREATRRLGRFREVVERPARPGNERPGERRRNLDDGNPDAIRPRRERVIGNARRRVGPVRARACFEALRAGMIVHVAHEQHGGRALRLRGERLAPGGGCLGCDEAVERAVGIALPRLMIERSTALPFTSPL